MNTLKKLMFAVLAAAGLSFVANSASYTTADYAQDGLVAMWDCSSIADGDTTWTDSKGNKVITFTGSGIGISSEGVSFPGDVDAYGTINATDTTSLFKTAAYNGTVEIVVKSAAAESDYMFAYQAPDYDSGKAAYQSLLFCYNASTKKSTYVVENPKSAVRKLPSDFSFDQINTFSVAYLAGKAINGGYVSGFPGDTESGTFSGSGVSGSEAIIGGRCTHANRALKGTIYAIRIYNRRLSPAEIVENARLDKLRFIDKAEKPTFEDTPTEWGYTRQAKTAEGWELVEVYRATGKTYPWTVPDGVAKIDLLVVAGGGSGGSSSSGYPGTIAGGGGAGGIVYEQGIKVTPGSIYGIEVGLGGERTLGANGKTGGDSKFGDYYVAKGGGWGKFGGGSSSSSNGGEGGSGGGGSYGTANSTATQPNQPCGGYGHAGVKALSGAGGGGGGAGSAAGLIGAATYSPSGAFGAGMTIDITGEPEVYAVGGQGGLKATKQAGFSGRDGYGDGGSASIASDTTGGNIESGKGGDGVVIVRYTPTYQVIFSDPENATILVKVDDQPISSKDTVLNGTDIVVEVMPNKFYEYAVAPEGWEKIEDSPAITRTFKVDYKDLEIEAPAPTEKPTFTVTALTCENGSITGAGTYYRDEVAALTAIPDKGYAFKSWTGAAEGKEGAVIELTITADIEVGATFEKMAADKRLVTYTGGENTSYTVKSDGEDVLPGSTVDVGATVVAVVKPNEHYAFIKPIPEGWVAGEEPGSLTKTFTADEDVTFEIPSAELITFVLEIAQPEHGVISGTEPGTLTEGDPVELSVEFDGGVYQFVNWTTNGAPAGTETTLAFTMQDNMSVAAVIEKIPPVELKITNDATKQSYVATTNGVEVPAGSMLDWNTVVTIVATSQFGYKYLTIPEGWSKGAEPRSITRDFTANTRPLEITIPDAEGVAVYSLSITQPENGVIWGAESGSYETGDKVKLTATPSEVGYCLVGWTVNGEVAGSANPLDLTLEADTIVAAVFEAVKIPRPYIRVDYISTTADGKQYIDTGIKMQNKLRVEFDFKLNSVDKTYGGYLMGGYGGSTDNRQYVLNVSNDKVWRGGADSVGLHKFETIPTAVVGTRYQAESLFDDDVHTLTINGWPESFKGTTKKSASNTLYLFNYYYTTSSSGYPSDATLYSCRMFTGASSKNPGVLVREFLPVYNRDTKKYGLYDTVGGKFYPSKTADFIGAKLPGLAILFF